MPRHCVLCGKKQGKAFSVFSFPVSLSQAALWIDVIRKARPDFAEGMDWEKVGLKNGVCQLHFHSNEFSNGKKCRLQKCAIPSVNISTISEKYYIPNESNDKDGCSLSDTENYIDSGKTSLSKQEFICSVEINCQISNDFQDDQTYGKQFSSCLLCGSQNLAVDIVSIFENSIGNPGESLLQSLVTFLAVSEERILDCGSSICKLCFKNVEEILKLKAVIENKIASLKDTFNITSNIVHTGNEYSCFLEVEGEHLKMVSKRLAFQKKEYMKRKSIRLIHKNSKNALPCPECPATFPTLSALEYHTTQIDEKDTLKKSCHNIWLINNRMPKMLHRHPCTECKEVFNALSDLNLHKKAFHEYSECSYCGRYIATKARLLHHLYKFHGVGEAKLSSHPCHLCTKRFTSTAGLRYHNQVFHKKGKIYTCEICRKIFYYKILYKSHKLYSHGEKSVICEKCGNMFFTVSKLNSHINAVHRNALSWMCKFCGDKFSTASSYKHHVTFRHKPIHHTCSVCGIHFKKKNSLIQHFWKHYIFFCLKCKVNFTNWSFYSTHMLNCHNTSVERKFKSKFVDVVASNVDDTAVIEVSKKENIVINDILITSDLNPYSPDGDSCEKSKMCGMETSKDILCLSEEQFESEVSILNSEILENIEASRNCHSVEPEDLSCSQSHKTLCITKPLLLDNNIPTMLLEKNQAEDKNLLTQHMAYNVIRSVDHIEESDEFQ